MNEKSEFSIGKLVDALGGRLIHGDAEATFDTYCIDSRYVDRRTLFVPLMGQSRDGHQFIIDAISKGAVGAIVRAGHHQVHEITGWLRERAGRGGYSELENVCIIEVRHTLVALQKLAEWFRLHFDTNVIGITGSVGKTGTKEMLIQLLSTQHQTIGTEKNFNNEIGVPLALAKITPQTKMAVIEMAMRARGEISLLSRIAHPNLAIITNTSGSHVGRLGSFEEVYKAKCEIVAGMPDGSKLVLNRHDANITPVLQALRDRREGPRDLEISYFDASNVYLNCGLSSFTSPGVTNGDLSQIPEADVWVEDVKVNGLKGSELTLCTKDEREKVQLNMLGRGAIENLVAAAAAAHQFGMSMADVAETAPNLLPAPQRLNLFRLRQHVYLVDDCYNSSPASFIDSMEFLLSIDPRFRKMIVLGDMLELGKFETLLHRQCAQTVLNLPVEIVYAVGPRMNAVNEVEGNEDIDLYYVEGHTDYGGFGGGRQGTRFGNDMIGDRQQRSHGNVILDDGAASKLSTMLISEINNSDQPTVLLVKGSRALHLERIINDLLCEIN